MSCTGKNMFKILLCTYQERNRQSEMVISDLRYQKCCRPLNTSLWHLQPADLLVKHESDKWNTFMFCLYSSQSVQVNARICLKSWLSPLFCLCSYILIKWSLCPGFNNSYPGDSHASKQQSQYIEQSIYLNEFMCHLLDIHPHLNEIPATAGKLSLWTLFKTWELWQYL